MTTDQKPWLAEMAKSDLVLSHATRPMRLYIDAETVQERFTKCNVELDAARAERDEWRKDAHSLKYAWERDHACECTDADCDCPGCSLTRKENAQ